MLQLDLLQADHSLVELSEVQLSDKTFSPPPRYSLHEARLSPAVLVLPGHHPLGLQDLLDLGQLVPHQPQVLSDIPLHVVLHHQDSVGGPGPLPHLDILPLYPLSAADGGEGAGQVLVGTHQVPVCGEDFLLQEISTLGAGGALGLQPLVTPGEVNLVLCQGADHLTLSAPHGQLLDLSVGDGVGEDVGRGDVGVVVGTGLALREPGEEAGEAEPVATGGLVRVSLTEQADRALELVGELLQEVVLVSSLVIVPGVHCETDD